MAPLFQLFDVDYLATSPIIKIMKLRSNLLALLLLVAAPALAEIRLVAGDAGLHCRPGTPAPSGLMCDLLAELARRVHHSGKIELVPHARLKAMMRSGATQTFYLPVPRVEWNEHRYKWVVEMLRDDYVIITPAGSPTIDTFEQAKQVGMLGVLRGGESEIMANKLGFTNLQPSSQDIAVKKMAMGRLDAWFTTWNAGRFLVKASGQSLDSIQRGRKLMDARLSMAASADVDDAEIQKWRAAFDAMKADGTVERAYRKYDIQLAR